MSNEAIRPDQGRILVMDDDITIQQGLEVFLTEFGYGVVCTNDGRQAIDIYVAEL